jgi:hypothetical protein
LAALAIAEQSHGDTPITIVDEIERGLEPYRQRVLIERLQSDDGQVFITTHSPAILSAASDAALWYVDHTGNMGPLDAQKIAAHREDEPETFLSVLAIIGEGPTEVGFARTLLSRAVETPLLRVGVHVSNGGGHEKTLDLLEALVAGGLRFGCFVDDEDGKHPTRWAAVEKAQGALAFRWKNGCLEQNIINAVPANRLEDFLIDSDGEKTGYRLRTLAERLGIAEKNFETISTTAADNFRALITEAALGRVPADKADQTKEYKKHAQDWFKSEAGGRELADKIFNFGLWPTFREQLLPFCNAVRLALGLAKIDDLPGQ